MLNDLKKELDEVFNRQLLDLLRNRHIFLQLDEAWKRNVGESVAIELQGFMWQVYLAFACAAVRRMLDQDPRSVSLWYLLKRLKEPATLALVCRAEFRKGYTNDLIRRKRADADYDTVTGGQPELTAAIIDQDIDDIKDAAKPIRDLVDTAIAHSDRAEKLGATLNHLDAAIEKMAEVYDRYALLLGVLLGGGIMRPGGIALDDVTADIAKIWP
jgi:hypothetical protein